VLAAPSTSITQLQRPRGRHKSWNQIDSCRLRPSESFSMVRSLPVGTQREMHSGLGPGLKRFDGFISGIIINPACLNASLTAQRLPSPTFFRLAALSFTHQKWIAVCCHLSLWLFT
jgi:hypothetical protein